MVYCHQFEQPNLNYWFQNDSSAAKIILKTGKKFEDEAMGVSDLFERQNFQLPCGLRPIKL